MGTEIALLEPIKAPDRRGKTQPLPEWVELRLACVSDEQQPDRATGHYRSMPTLPAKMMLSPMEQRAISRHVEDLRPLLEQTPVASADYEAATLVLVTKMMLALPAQRSNEAGAEAAGEAFMAALDDVPTWAVDAAIRGWYRGESPKIAKEPHDFRWRPAPATLRCLAYREMHSVKGRILALEKLLNVVERIEFTDEQRQANLERLRKILGEVFGSKNVTEALVDRIAEDAA